MAIGIQVRPFKSLPRYKPIRDAELPDDSPQLSREPTRGLRFQAAASLKANSLFRHDGIAKLPLFKGRDPRFVEQVMLDVAVEVFQPGSIILREGDSGESMYLLNRGDVEIVVGGNVVATLSDGSVFGEIALLGVSSKRTATVRASSFCDCRVIQRAPFIRLLQSFPAERLFYETEARRRLQELQEGAKSRSKSPPRQPGQDRRSSSKDRPRRRSSSSRPARQDTPSSPRTCSTGRASVTSAPSERSNQETQKPPIPQRPHRRHSAHAGVPQSRGPSQMSRSRGSSQDPPTSPKARRQSSFTSPRECSEKLPPLPQGRSQSARSTPELTDDDIAASPFNLKDLNLACPKVQRPVVAWGQGSSCDSQSARTRSVTPYNSDGGTPPLSLKESRDSDVCQPGVQRPVKASVTAVRSCP